MEILREKVRSIMTAQFGAVTIGPDGTILFGHEAAFGYIQTEPWMQDHSLVQITCSVADEVPISPELFEWAATEGQSFHFGHVLVLRDEEPADTASIIVRHSLLGDALDADELLYAIFGVFGAGNTLSSEVPARFGGKSFVTPMAAAGEPTGKVSRESLSSIGGTQHSGSAASLEAALDALDELIGLESVKQEVRLLAARHRLNVERSERGMESVPVSLHLVFTGNPGTGKTTVARVVAEIYRGLGLLPKGQLVEVQRADMIAGFVGQTALKTQALLQTAMGGVLFIDEAYSLSNGSDQDYGQEAVATLVKMMEDHRDEVAVIAAGYSREMTQFVQSNSGLKSRFQKFIEFPDYETKELVAIFVSLAETNGIKVSEDVRAGLDNFFSSAAMELRVGNGRFARNIFEDMYARMALRAGADDQISDSEIAGFVVSDIPIAIDGAEPPETPGYL